MLKFILYVVFCIVLFTVGWVFYPPDDMTSTILCIMAHAVAGFGAGMMFVGIKR